MRVNHSVVVVICLALSYSCTTSKKLTGKTPAGISKLKFINEYVVPHAFSFKGTTVGGLSSIDYDPGKDLYYMVCDDRSEKNPARFYTARIHMNAGGIDSVQFIDAVTILDKNGKPFPSRAIAPSEVPDPESMRFNPERNELIWGSEGERIVDSKRTVLKDPGVYRMDLQGKYKDSFALPANMRIQLIEKGPRRNGVFEGLSFSDDYHYVFVSVEEPRYEDGLKAGSGDSTAWVRFIKFDIETSKQVAQYAYQIDPIAYPSTQPGGFGINGISEILYTGNDQFIVMERSFSSGRNGNTIRLFLADARHASDIASVDSLEPAPSIKPITKKLLLNLDDLGRYIDNVEGITFGPILPNGHKSLILVSDDNFDTEEKTQFFLFEIVP